MQLACSFSQNAQVIVLAGRPGDEGKKLLLRVGRRGKGSREWKSGTRIGVTMAREEPMEVEVEGAGLEQMGWDGWFQGVGAGGLQEAWSHQGLICGPQYIFRRGVGEGDLFRCRSGRGAGCPVHPKLLCS